MPLPKRPRTDQKPPREAAMTVAAISFSLTFVGVSLALLSGLLPPRVSSLGGSVDTAVVLLFVPLCALVFTIVAEVFRATLAGARPSPAPLGGWRPGNRKT